MRKFGAILTLLVAGSLSAPALAERVVNVFGSSPFSGNLLTTIDNFYENLSDTTSTIISGPLNSNNLTGVNLLWAVQPQAAYTASELVTMQNYLAAGGRIAFLGEHGALAPNENDRISAAIAAIGGHISIINTIVDPGFRVASKADGQILTHPLTDGVNSYSYAAFAPLLMGLGSQTLMLGEDDPTTVMMGYENIGPGSIFLITDQNVWDVPFAEDNEVLFENLLSGVTGAVPVPEPATMALLSVGLLGLGYATRRRRRQEG